LLLYKQLQSKTLALRLSLSVERTRKNKSLHVLLVHPKQSNPQKRAPVRELSSASQWMAAIGTMGLTSIIDEDTVACK
jgi:hypothetical protein